MKLNKLTFTAMAALALITQPFYALASSQVAFAAPLVDGPLSVQSECINGVVVHTTTFREQMNRWVSGDVFYKIDSEPVVKHSLPKSDVDVWTVETGMSVAVSATIIATAKGLVTKSSFPFLDTKSYSHTVKTDAVDCRQLNGENFNTVADSYKGISVGFNVQYFSNVSAVRVTIDRADGTTVTKNANQDVIDLVESAQGAPVQITAPFVIEPGTFNEADDLMYWAPATPATWTALTTPVKATITVTDEYGLRTAVIENFSQGDPSWPTYESLLPGQGGTTTPPPVKPEDPKKDSPKNGNPTVALTPITNASSIEDPIVYASTEDTSKVVEDTNKEDEVLGSESLKGEVSSTTAAPKEWSVINVVLAGVVAAMSLITLAGVRGSEGRSKTFRLLTIAPAVAAIVAVLLVEDFSTKLGFVNGWTLLFAATVAAQALLMSQIKTPSSK